LIKGDKQQRSIYTNWSVDKWSLIVRSQYFSTTMYVTAKVIPNFYLFIFVPNS